MQGLYNLEEGGVVVCTNKTGSVLFTLHACGKTKQNKKKTASYGAWRIYVAMSFCPRQEAESKGNKRFPVNTWRSETAPVALDLFSCVTCKWVYFILTCAGGDATHIVAWWGGWVAPESGGEWCRVQGREVAEMGRQEKKKKKKKKREAFLNAANQSGGARPSLPHQPTVIQMCWEPGIKCVTVSCVCVCKLFSAHAESATVCLVSTSCVCVRVHGVFRG